MKKLTRREFARLSALGAGALMIPWDLNPFGPRGIRAAIPGGSLPPADVPKFVSQLVKPPALRRVRKRMRIGRKNAEVYEIAVRQFNQQILPSPLPQTTVWSYCDATNPKPVAEGGTLNYPAFTIEAKYDKPTVIKWINGLVDSNGDPLPHLLPVDQTLHWCNPEGLGEGKDRRGAETDDPYTGPVPMVTHVHGAHTTEESDGYAEAWWLPANSPAQYEKFGTFYEYFQGKYDYPWMDWGEGYATYKYTNDQPATTLWYHDHALGMTRLNVYAGPAGYYLIRGGDNDLDLGYAAPGPGIDPFGEFTEIPIVIQDRSFNVTGSLFYPDNRAFFDEFPGPYIGDPDHATNPTHISPIWNPEFFGNMMVVNGNTWPFLEVEQRRYRFRFLNGCNSRFLDLKMTQTPRGDNSSFNAPEYNFFQIGADQGFLPAAVELNHLLMAPAERADVVVDFTNVPVGTEIYLVNDGPDAPFGGISTEDLSDWKSTGQVMKFVVKAATSGDTTTHPLDLVLPSASVPGATADTRNVTLNEEMYEPADAPVAALLGTQSGGPKLWMDAITETPGLSTTEEWVIHNFTGDAHPIHVHQVKFEVMSRVDENGNVRGPEPWETGPKDTVIAYPGEKTRIKMHFDLPGIYVWHCHIVEHEDNEMMRPMYVGPMPNNLPTHTGQ